MKSVLDEAPAFVLQEPLGASTSAWLKTATNGRGSDNLRAHLERSTVRFLTLVSVDLASVMIGRQVLRWLHSDGMGPGVGAMFRSLLPANTMSAVELAVALVFCMAIVGGYRTGDQWRDPARVLGGAGLAVLLPTYDGMWTGAAGLMLLRGLVVWVVLGTILVFARILMASLMSWFPRPRFDHRVVEIHAGDAEYPTTDLGPGFRHMATLTVSGSPDDFVALEDWLGRGADTILVAGEVPPGRFGALTDFALAHGCRLLTVPRSEELVTSYPQRVWLRGRPFVELTRPSLRAQQTILKRILDVVAAGALLILLSPVLLSLALWVKLDSPGPALFRQRRPGLWGRSFGMLKFRSMRLDAEDVLLRSPELFDRFVANGCKLPEHEDPRITRAGRFLRKTSLDELPQLINVLMGEMSLVGPRPLVGPEIDHYAERAPALLSVKPGITGLWQVSGRSSVGFPERAEMDLSYVRNWSLLRDVAILFLTVPAVLMRRGAH